MNPVRIRSLNPTFLISSLLCILPTLAKLPLFPLQVKQPKIENKEIIFFRTLVT